MIDTKELQMRIMIQRVLEGGTAQDKEDLIRMLADNYFAAHRMLKDELLKQIQKRDI